MVNEGREVCERGIFLLGVAVFFFIIGNLVGVEYQKRQQETIELSKIDWLNK